MASATAEPQATSGSTGPSLPAAGPGAGVGDAASEKSDNWRFVEPQPIRQDQVENAVNFLSHPKVRGSPVVYRRSFLEKKGLSREEIDEAFRRVPDPPSDSSSTPPSTSVGQTQAINPPRHAVQLAVPVGEPIVGQLTVTKSRSWGQMLLALGILTAAGAGAGIFTKKYFIPKLKEWILEIVSGKNANGKIKPSPVEEATTAAATAAAAAATAATQMASAMQDLAKSKVEDRARLDSIVRAVEAQTLELKSTLAGMRDAVQIAEVTKYQRSVTNDIHSNGVTSPDSLKGQTNGARTTSGSEIQVVDARMSNSRAAADPSSVILTNVPQANPRSTSPSNGQIHAPRSQSYLDVLDMLERGEKPPGIKEVNDKPPNPNQPPSNPRLQPRPKPWEKSTVEAWPISAGVIGDTNQSGRYQDNWGAVGHANGSTELDSSLGAGHSAEPWWRKRPDTDTVFSSSSVKITEVDPVSEVDIETVNIGQASSSSLSGPSKGGRAGWVPPPVPQPVYPGADEAIRRPKSATNGASSRILPSQADIEPSSGVHDAYLTNEKSTSQVFTKLLNDSAQSSPPLPEQIDNVAGDQEEGYLDRGLVDTTDTVKDLAEDESSQQP